VGQTLANFEIGTLGRLRIGSGEFVERNAARHDNIGTSRAYHELVGQTRSLMPEPEPDKSRDKKSTDEGAEAARERKWREMIEQAEKKKSGSLPPQKESPHDFIERTMNEKPKK
jgi:hypothetical protein